MLFVSNAGSVAKLTNIEHILGQLLISSTKTPLLFGDKFLSRVASKQDRKHTLVNTSYKLYESLLSQKFNSHLDLAVSCASIII